VATTEAGTDTLLAENTLSTTLRASGVNLTVYPNPFEGNVNLSVTLPEAQEGTQEVTVRVFNTLGQQVAVPVVEEVSDAESISFRQLRSLASGVYFFHVRGEDFVATTRAVRVR
jgi:hypothetical protein